MLTGSTHLDGFPDQIRDVVHEHWGKFPPQHPLVVDIFGLIFFLLTIMSLFGNGLVIYIFLATKQLRTPVSFQLMLVFAYLKLVQ